jgi:phage-related protein
MPICRSLHAGLWELRSTIRHNIARIIFFVHEEELVLLNGFLKKTQKAPEHELELALKRKREVEKVKRQ